jgi:nucleotide-binding universal stress UspA family protein
MAGWTGIASAIPPSEGSQAHGRAVLDALLLEAGDALLDVDFELELVEGSAAGALESVGEREDADEIVLGSRGQGRVGSALGSVSHELLRIADRPVVVIPPRAVDELADGVG